MPDPFGLSEGVKGLSAGLDGSREAAKSVTKSIENIQNDSLEVAQQKAQERRRAAREAELIITGLPPSTPLTSSRNAARRFKFCSSFSLGVLGSFKHSELLGGSTLTMELGYA